MNFLSPPNSPIETASAWFEHATNTVETPNPLAMTLSTLQTGGMIASRTLLLKGFNEDGALFFTNYNSAKALEIEQHEEVAMLFHWDSLQRQIRIQGVATKIDSLESDSYFATRARLSQLGAWASDQSQTLDNRESLLSKVKTFEEKWEGQEIPRPAHWGGYRVSLRTIEFWEGLEGRLHDRIRYTNDDSWSWEFLQP